MSNPTGSNITNQKLLIDEVYDAIVDALTQLFNDWPYREVVRQEELQKHFSHAVTMTYDRDTDGIHMYCDQCKVIMTVNVGHPVHEQ
jgi:hypothetical protein